MSYIRFGQMILFLCCLHIGLACVGQKVKYKSITVGEKIELHGVIEYLQPSQTFAVEIPKKLVYFERDARGGDLYRAPMTTYAKIKAVQVKGDVPADFTFRITTPGISLIDTLMPAKRSNGYFGEIFYVFPGSLEVCDREGNVIRHYVLRDERTLLRTTYHPTFLANQSQQSLFEEKQPMNGFASKDLLLKTFEKEKEKSYAQIEATELDHLIASAREIMTFGYGTYVWPYKFTYMDLDKNGQTAYPELAGEIQKYASDLVAYTTDSDNAVYPEKFAGYADFFAAQLEKEMPAEVVTCCAFNAICCYSMAEDLPQADLLFRKYKKSFGLFVAPRLDDFGYGYSARQLMRDQDEVVYYQTPLSFTARIKAEEEAAAKAAKEEALIARNEAYRARLERLSKRNIRKVEGYVIDKDGNKYEGRLDAHFIAAGPSGMIDMSIGKHVMVYPKEGKIRGFGPAKVQYFVADSTYFFPLKEYNPSGVKAIAALGGVNAMGRTFYEKVYETGRYMLYFNRTVEEDSYLIGIKGSVEAIPTPWIWSLNAGALAKLPIPADLQTRLQSGEFGKDDVAGMKAFMDALEKAI